jgi:hypothetical protein
MTHRHNSATHATAFSRRDALGARRRSGYTLLEVVLAAFITVLLMVALYTTLNMQYWHAEAGRNAVEKTTLAQGLMKRIADDIAQELAPLVPNSSSSQGGVAGASGTGASTSTTTTASGVTVTAVVSGATSATSTTATSSGSGGAGAALSGGPVTFNLGVQGSANQLTLYVSRFPREVMTAYQNNGNQNNLPIVSDLRQVTYWLAPSGLARQEIKQETSTDPNNAVPPDVPNADSYVISDRVKSLTFSYWDGQNWQDTWDGTAATGQDGVTPQGPPMAIRIEMQIAPPRGAGADDSKNWKTYRQTVFIPTANRLQLTAAQQPLGTGQ